MNKYLKTTRSSDLVHKFYNPFANKKSFTNKKITSTMIWIKSWNQLTVDIATNVALSGTKKKSFRSKWIDMLLDTWLYSIWLEVYNHVLVSGHHCLYRTASLQLH